MLLAMDTYFIAQINIHDPEKYERYLAGYDAVLEKYEGRVRAVDENVRTLEGHWRFKRTVVIEFPDEEALLDWYESQEYQELAEHRRAASEANIVIVHGRD